MNANKLYELQEKLTKYIKFLSSQFNINVEFETPKCERKENTIYLPSLTTLSNEEADSLFGVLLLESGFLTSSQIKEESALIKLKTQLHANLSKIIEAARIENELKNKFGGAQEILDDLWKNTINEKNLKQRFFPKEYWNNEWGAICYYAHEKITNPKKDFNLICEEMKGLFDNEKIYKLAIKNLNQEKQLIDNILKKNIKDTNSSINIAEKIHQIHFLNKKDNSPVLDFKKIIEAKKKADELAKKLKEKIENNKKEIEGIESKIQSLKDIRKTEYKKISNVIQPIRKEYNNRQSIYRTLNKFNNISTTIENIENNINYNNQKINQKQEKIKNHLEKITNINDRLNSTTDQQIKLTQEEKTNIEKSLGLNNPSLNDIENKTEELNNLIDKLKDQISDLKDLKSSEKNYKKLNDNKIKQENVLNKLKDSLSDYNDKLSKALANNKEQSVIDNLTNKINDLKDNINDKQNNLNSLINDLNNVKNDLLNNSETNNFNNQSSFTTLEDKLNKIDEKISKTQEILNNENQKLKESAKLLKQHSLDEEKINKLKNDLVKLNNKIVDEKNNIDKINNKIKQLNNDLQKINTDKNLLNDLIDILSQKFNSQEIKEFLNNEINSNSLSNKDVQKFINDKLKQLEKKEKLLNKNSVENSSPQSGNQGTPSNTGNGSPQSGNQETLSNTGNGSPQSGNQETPSNTGNGNNINEEIKNFIEENIKYENKQIESLQKKIEDLMKPLYQIDKTIENENKIIEEKSANVIADIMKETTNLDNDFSNAGIDTKIYPFQEMKGWDEANEIQKSFDAKATMQSKKPIVNGMNIAGLGPGQFLNETMQQLENAIEINVQELFGDKVMKTSLEEFGSSTKQYYEDMDKNVFGSSSKPHIAGTKKFDKTEKLNYCTDSEKINSFEKIKNKYSATVAEMKKTMLQTMKFSKKPLYKGGKEEGELDSRNIYKLASGLDNDFYEISKNKYVNKISATILIDISGSMDKDPEKSYEQAIATAYILSEGLKSVHIKHEIVGYGAQYNEEMKELGFSDFYNRKEHNLIHNIYKTYEDKNNNGLANLEFTPIDNCDGESIENIYKKLKKRQEKTKMVFVISDFKPFLYNADTDILDEDLKRVLRNITNDKNHFFGIGFEKGPENILKERYICLENIKDFPKYIKNISFDEKNKTISVKKI